MKRKFLYALLPLLASTLTIAATTNTLPNKNISILNQSGFFRASYDYLSMPHHMEKMGLVGANYYADITPSLYTGVGMYGSTIGTQGGLFVFTVGGGWHHPLFHHLWGDAGFDVGGGGGRSSMVGGGLMVRPHAGLQYDFGIARLGVHYSFIKFPSGDIHSSQVGANLDIPFDFYYIKQRNLCGDFFQFKDIALPWGEYLTFEHNDFGFLFQAYKQHSGTKNNENQIQDGTMGLIGAEFDHYFRDSTFWWIKGSGAFTGIPNGYMDILAGLGYHLKLGRTRLALVPQLGAGAGGGGKVDTGGGILVQPQLGLELPLSKSFSLRGSGGYLWAPKGQMGAYTLTGTLLYHLDVGTAGCRYENFSSNLFTTQGWRVNVFNQTYLHPQRTFDPTTSAINLLALQIDQLFNPWVFMSYQGAFAYAGFHAGGYASGMIGPGFQTGEFFANRVRFFTEILVGAGGGGSLKLGSGALVEPMIGAHLNLTQTLGLQASVGQLKAFHEGLNSPVVNVGLTMRFGTIDKVRG